MKLDRAARTVGIHTPLHYGQRPLAAWWKTQHDEISALMREDGPEILATEDFQRFKAIGDFYRRVPGIFAPPVRRRATAQF